MEYYIVVDSLGYMTRIETGIHKIEEYDNKVQIPEDFFNIAINNFSKYDFINPKIKNEKIEEFLLENIFEWEDIKEKAKYYFEEILCFDEKRGLTQVEKDIKVLAEALNSILEPMVTGNINPVLTKNLTFQEHLIKVQEILERYK